MMKKIVFMDVDGTLVSYTGHIPESARDACKKARANGHLLYLATGRQYAIIDDEILAPGFDGVISAGGARIDIKGNTIFNGAFKRNVLEHIIRFFDKNETGYTFERRESLVAVPRVFEYLRKERAVYGAAIDRYIESESVKEGIPDPAWDDVAKVIFCGSDKFSLNDVRREFAGECEVFGGSIPFYGEGHGELGPAGIDKGSAVGAVLNYLGLKKEDAIAIGDGDNDMPLLRACGTGIAMGNADPGLKKAASYVSSDIEEDGLEKAFRHYGLIA